MSKKLIYVVLWSFLCLSSVFAQNTRTLSGVVVNQQFELVPTAPFQSATFNL